MNNNSINYSPTEKQAKEDYALSQGLTALLKIAHDLECCKTSSGGVRTRNNNEKEKPEEKQEEKPEEKKQVNKPVNKKKQEEEEEESSSDDENEDDDDDDKNNSRPFWEDYQEEDDESRCTKKEIKGYRSYANMILLLSGGGGGVLLGPTTLSAISSLTNLLIDTMGYPTVEKLCTGTQSFARSAFNSIPLIKATGYSIKTCSDAINFQDGVIKASMASITVALGVSEGFFKTYKPSTIRDKLAAKICAYFKRRHLNLKPNISSRQQEDLEEQLKFQQNGGKRFTKKRVVYKSKRRKTNKRVVIKKKNTIKSKRSKSKRSKSKRSKSKRSKTKRERQTRRR